VRVGAGGVAGPQRWLQPRLGLVGEDPHSGERKGRWDLQAQVKGVRAVVCKLAVRRVRPASVVFYPPHTLLHTQGAPGV
jgi:hypothetical protein